MTPATKENGGSGRRKSMNLFSRTSINSLTPINTDIIGGNEKPTVLEKKDSKRQAKRSSVFGLGPSTASESFHDLPLSSVGYNGSDTSKARPRTLQKGRPSSLFGSLGKRSVHNMEEAEPEILHSTTPESPMDEGRHYDRAGGSSKAVLHHGEVQTTSGMFRKKKEYLVLTDTYLIRFKTQSRASETFPSIPPAHGRSNTTRHPSTTSIGSLQEVQSNTSHASADSDNRIPLGQVVTAYKVEDGRPFFTTEVVYLDEEYHGVGSIQLMLHDPKEADLWHTSIRGAAQKARLLMEEPYPERVVRYLVQILEVANDYDANHFQLFRVVRRAAIPKGGWSSSDDLQKLGDSVFYMVIGINRIHLIPLPDFSNSSGRLVSSKANRMTFGIVTLVYMGVQYADDRFELAFRLPLQAAKQLDLAASATPDIATVIIRACQYLKPQWLDYTFLFGGPRRLFENADVPLAIEEEDDGYGGFDRTLVAYCLAYSCSPANIQYAIDWEVEDAPEFRLFPPANTKKYTIHELLAILRSLRYNESFRSVSFRDIDLHCLHGLHDSFGADHTASSTRPGISLKYFNIKPLEGSLLYQEIQGIALKSLKLRRMNFTNTLPRRRPKDTFDAETQEIVEKDPGCEIVAAILPLCREQLTNVTWLILSGIELGETDLDELVPACNRPEAKLRAIECSHSGLNDRGVMQLLGLMERQAATLECINIGDNPGRINLERFQVSMSRFAKIRRLDLSRITRTSGEEPLIVPEVMLSWRLEELVLNGIPVNDKTLDSISAYLASEMSNSLRVLEMEQCNLSGSHVAVLMRSMTRVAGEPRNLQLHVSANRLEKGIDEIVKAIEENCTPSAMIVRMIEFKKEDRFRRLLEALRTNTTIRSLDISKASLPYDAGPETCDALRRVFADNITLQDLDISGEQAHLEVTRFGIGLNQALTGLKNNTALKSLRIEYQNLGLEGANTLSSVIEENKTLTHIHCEHNDINLQGFTILVNALTNNFAILELPFMQDDQNESMKRMNESMRDTKRNVDTEVKKGSVRRTLTAFGVSKPPKQEMTPQDLDTVVRVLEDKWATEIGRLAMFLSRNSRIAAGEEGYDLNGENMLSDDAMRPTTAMSDKGILEHVLSNTTPKVELVDPVDAHVGKLASMGINDRIDVRDGKQNETLAEYQEELVDDDATPRKSAIPARGLPQLPPITRENIFELDNGVFEMES